MRPTASVLSRDKPLPKQLRLTCVGCAVRTKGKRVPGARGAPYEPESSKQ